MPTLMDTLNTLHFDNRFIRDLPADPETDNYSRQVTGICYSRVKPKIVRQPQLLAYAKEVADLLDLSAQACTSEHFAQVFSGNRLLEGSEPYASCYGGHQFGHWAGQLGDGRAINLGEIINQQGQRWALQLKGAGPTPYSRGADGFAVLRSSLREFLCSEAMYHLGVPTTRALSLMLSGENIVRDMFYDGNAKAEPGAIVCRVAPSFLRFGHFQIHYAKGQQQALQQLMDYTLRTDFPHLGKPSPQVYVEWFKEVRDKTAQMVVEWMRVGFVHGVMNTDNMSILGLTIDYGPYGWIDAYDPNWTPNTTDAANRRYCFGQQGQISHWNLGQLAQAILPLVGEVEPLQEVLNEYPSLYETAWQKMMSKKLGLATYQAETDKTLIDELLALLQLVETDMTLFFRQLAHFSTVQEAKQRSHARLIAPFMDSYYHPDALNDEYIDRFAVWLERYAQRTEKDGYSDQQRAKNMNAVNPLYVLRNYLAQQAIDQVEQGDDTMLQELLALLRHPYDEQADKTQYAQKRPEWARNRAGCSMLSCSS